MCAIPVLSSGEGKHHVIQLKKIEDMCEVHDRSIFDAHFNPITTLVRNN